jgi:chemotaxis signal transduction protein
MIQGLINLHGEILPLIDPRPLLGLPPGDGAAGAYLVVVHNPGQDISVAWLVDGLGGMALLDPDRISPPGQGGPADPTGNGMVSGTAGHRGRSLLLLDGRRLASEESIEQAAGSWAARSEVGL